MYAINYFSKYKNETAIKTTIIEKIIPKYENNFDF